MANDVPAGIEIEPVFVIEATYAPDAQETRPRVRPQHLARIADLMAKGVVIEAGGIRRPVGRAPDRSHVDRGGGAGTRTRGRVHA